MSSTPDADLAALATVTSQLEAVLASIADDQWTLPTPCDDWDLAALVDHVTGGNWYTVRLLAGDSSDDALAFAMAQFGDGSATAAQAIGAARDQLEAFGRPGVLDETWPHIAGSLSGRHVLRLRLHDVIVHTWDIAETVNPPALVAPELARWGLAELAEANSLTAAHHELGPPPEPPVDTAPSTAYLRAFGR